MRLATAVILRRDWDFLFDQLRSVSAVVDYLHRVSGEKQQRLGREAERYYELAQADEEAVTRPAAWATKLGGASFSHPLLPKEPPTAADTTGHTVHRIIMEEIARSELERNESDRLAVLTLIDRVSVGTRAELGRLILSNLDEVMATPPGGSTWKFRRVLQDEGRLHLAFGVCNSFTELHREAFCQWATLRHYDLLHSGLNSDPSVLKTVAVLLTPRYDGPRSWDTTLIAIAGDLELEPSDLAAMRSLWDRQGTPKE